MVTFLATFLGAAFLETFCFLVGEADLATFLVTFFVVFLVPLDYDLDFDADAFLAIFFDSFYFLNF